MHYSVHQTGLVWPDCLYSTRCSWDITVKSVRLVYNEEISNPRSVIAPRLVFEIVDMETNSLNSTTVEDVRGELVGSAVAGDGDEMVTTGNGERRC
jgi:hypothetical protein